MAERGEGTGTLGGSHSRTTTAPTLSSGTRTRNNQVVEFVVEGVGGGPSNILPLRKRKFAFSEVVKRQSRNETHNLETDFNIDTTNLRANSPSSSCSSSYKRRRIISGDSETELKETLVEDCVSSRKSCYSPSVKRQKRDSDHRGKLSSPTLATQSPPTPSKHSGVVRSSPGQRRSSRGSYPIGFYAEEEQKSLAAFRDRTSELKSKGQEPELIFCAGEVDTKRSFRASSKQESKGVQLQQRQFHLYRSDTGSKKSRSRKKKMTENKPSWNVIEGKSYEKVKEYQDLDPICVETTKILKQKASRRHTLPGRPDPNIAMGLTLTKCLAAKAHDNDQFSSTDEDSPEPKPSTSGVVTSFELSNGNNTPKMLDQIMKRLPRKKKSSSEQDLSQVNTEIPSSSEVKHGERNISAILRRNEEVKRRKSTNLENSSKKESYLSKEKLESCHVDEMRNNSERNHGGVLKSYPLRNRLRLSEGGGVISGATNNSSNNLSPILGGHMSANGTTAPVGSSPSHPSPIPPQITDPVVGHNQNHLSHSTPSPQSYSLPSSPSSPGVAFLDTFRRLRESRRLSHEQSQSSSNSKKGIQGKEGKQSSFLPCVSSSWKRGHGVRKSPIASKRGSRGKVINTNSSTNSRSSGGVCGGGSQGPLHIGSTAPPLSVPPTALGVLTTSASNSAGLLPASLPALGAIGNSGMGMNGGGTSGSSFNPGSNLGGALGGLMGAPGDSESEENEMGRLEALLASRGLPPSLFGALGPRMQHILHRSVSSSISSKAQQLLVGLQATGDEGEQLQAVIEMCQLLVMGNEDTLTGFPIKQVTPALINLLNMDHNFDMMNHACRALTYMMEALPRSSAVVVDAVPVFLEKLQVIQCMDVAEQSLTALNMLSRKHSKAILQAHGVSACLTYIDFFSSNAQRAALSITANCFQNLTADEFHFASDALPILSSRLTTQGDKKCVESVCHAYSRLVDCFQNDPNRLQEIASHGLLNNIQQLLVMSPPVLSSGTFIMVIRMLSLMCSNCPELAVTLLKNNIAQTLCYLLTNSTEPPPEQVELVPRSPQELYEITCLIGELMPVLPSDGIFVVDSALQRPTVSSHEMLTWQWQDERGQWHNYTPTDSRVIELAHQSGEDEISLCVNGITYTLDFHSMQQINDNTGTIRSILRRMVPAGSNANVNVQIQSTDARSKCLKEDEELASTLIKSLFSLLYEVYSSSAGPAVRYKCLRALLRMVHFSSPDLLQQVLKSQDVSSHLATMLSSLDLKIIVGALQMADLLMQKLPQIFAIYFRREGVMHQIKRLCKPDALASTSPVTVPLNKNSSPQIFDTSFNSMTISSGNGSPNSLSLGGGSPLLQSTARSFNGNCLDGTPPILPATAGSITASLNQEEEKLNNSSQLRLSDVLKRKRPKNTSRINVSGGGWRRGGRHEESNSSSPFSDFLIKNTGFSSTSSRDSWKGVSGSGGGRSKLLSSSSNSSTGGGSSASNSKTTSFLSNFNPVRWGRCNSSNSNPSQQDNHLMKEKIPTSISNTSSSHSPTVLIHSSSSAYSNREYIKNWIKDQAILLNERYFLTELQGCTHPALTVLNRLITAICQLDQEPDGAIPALKEISEIVSESDISPFEVIHSGLVRALLNYLTASEGAAGIPGPLSFSSSPSNILCSGEGGDNNMLGILATAASISSDSSASSAKPSNVTKVSRDKRIRNFLFVFLGCSLDPLSVSGIDADRVSAFSSLVAKLNGCVNQLEQFPVKVHDLPGTGLPGTGRGGSTSAIKFFNTHQLKCNLQRYPDCTKLRQWRGGPVKVDPLALVQAIERYLVIRGYGRLREDDEENSDDDNSDEDFDDTLAAVSVNHSTSNHKLQFLIGDQILPYNMTVYQAIRQYSSPDASTSEADTDSEMPISHSSIWLQTHTIYYRPLQEESSRSSSRKGKSGSKRSPKKKGDILFSESTIFGGSNSVLENQLLPYLPTSVTIRDPSLEVLSLLRVLYTINRYYGTLYPPAPFKAPLPMIEFVNMKLTAKANRQLQDPLVIMTGNLPQWLPQIAYACPFMFPFETRQLLFYAVSFDRDRALQRLMDSAPELNSSDSSERVTPRLERRKRTVSREDILKQAETVIGDLASSRAMLEIQYENEVGTGLGPTLEFYALVSKELQKADLELWRGDTVNVEEGNNGDVPGKVIKYINASTGLYPLPVSRSMKSGHVTKLKAKFKFLGKLMAKAVMDSRMLDLNLHECVYKWLLGEERSLGLQDVISLDPALGQTLSKLQNIVLQKKRFQEDSMISGTPVFELQQSIEALTVDGCNVEDLALNFTLPGFPNIELRKGGTDTEVTIHNIEQYLQLVVEWLIREGVWRQMEAFREGFELVFPVSQLQVFYPEELEQLFCGSVEAVPWDTKQLAECCRPDHGYTHNSKAVKFLLQILSEYTPQNQRAFLQFVTGSPRLPVGGFRSLSPPLTIVRKAFEAGENPDNFLPSVMTCVNYLKLPDYSTIEVMRAKLQLAAEEGQHSFHLS